MMFRFDSKLKSMFAFRKNFLIKESNEIKNFFVASFRNQGFTDKTLQKWKEVNRRIPGTKEYKYPKTKGLGRRTRAINVKTGRTRKSIVVKSVNEKELVVGSVGVDYAKYVNDARPFMGKSEVLRVKVKKKLKFEMDKILKGK